MEPHQETNSENFFFSIPKTSNLLNQNKFPSELLASYSPDFQYVEALIGSQSPDFQYVDVFTLFLSFSLAPFRRAYCKNLLLKPSTSHQDSFNTLSHIMTVIRLSQNQKATYLQTRAIMTFIKTTKLPFPQASQEQQIIQICQRSQKLFHIWRELIARISMWKKFPKTHTST